jgi:hypothetical protein
MRRTVTTLVLLLAAAGVSAPAFAGPYPDAGAPGWTRSDVRRYWPAPPPQPRYVHPILGWVELRGGFYDSQDVSKNDWTIGMKTAHVAPNVLLGFSADYQRRDDAVARSPRSTSTRPAMSSPRRRPPRRTNRACGRLWARSSSTSDGGIDPYFGGGAGWEFLNVQAYDYNRGYAYSADYDGFGYRSLVVCACRSGRGRSSRARSSERRDRRPELLRPVHRPLHRGGHQRRRPRRPRRAVVRLLAP